MASVVRPHLALALGLSFGLVACGGDDAVPAPRATGSVGAGGTGGGTGGSGGAGGTETPIPTVELAWKPCPLYTDETVVDGPEAECADVALPLYANDPGGKTLGYHVKRYAKPGSARTTQLWMLAGGPGASGVLYEKRAELLADLDPTLEIYLPDHRGTGLSSRLSCPAQETDGSPFGFFVSPGEWPKCFAAVQEQWGDDLVAFDVTNSANDVGILVESTRRADARVFVYGASYGTFWGHRYYQMFPKQADGVVLDAIAPPTASLARIDKAADDASIPLFQACIDDPGCGPRFDGDPRAFALDLYDRLDQGHCPAIQNLGPAHVLLRRAFGQMTMSWNARRLIPAALVRADRCNAEDAAAIHALFELYFLSTAQDTLLHNWGWVLSYYVTFSELWEQPEVSVEQMAAWRDAAVVSRDVTSGFEAPLAVFTRYPHDEWYGRFAESDTPLLMLDGTWDPATPPEPAKALEKAYTGPNQYWIDVPRGGHGSLGSAPTVDGELCGTSLVFDFLHDPTKKPDTTCLEALAPIDFDGQPDLNTLLFGTADAWGDP